ncbi:MAG: hypothetical protein KGV44_13865 [Flavobacteriaceae bacterium]|nr:hypothetical protein [Flavobacteriaceae bacterium]
MTTITFTLEEQSKVAEICSLLTKHGATNLTSSNPLPKHILKSVEKSIAQSDRREGTPNYLVHQKVRELCTK